MKLTKSILRDLIKEEVGSINIKDLGAALVGDDEKVLRKIQAMEEQMQAMALDLQDIKDSLAPIQTKDTAPTQEDPTGSGSD
tara:strand:+ start:35 stop:280 length:246 start_codon:yes stop_codon:yes gene_type:complete